MLPDKDSIRQYCTWLPAMMDCLLRTRGPVLELGGGFGTGILHEYCKDYRQLTTVETNDEWRNKLSKLYKSKMHKFVQELPEEGEWDVVLLDSAPNTTRQPYLDALKGRARHIVVHDVEPENFKGYGYNFERFEQGLGHVALWNDLMPHTAVLTEKR